MRILYLLAEILVLYLIFVGLGFGILALSIGFKDLGGLIAIFLVVSALPVAIRAATIGRKRKLFSPQSLLFGAYEPVRPIALVAPALAAVIGVAKKRFSFAFESDAGVTSLDIVDALAAKLDADGVVNHKSGGVLVEDNRVTWWLEPEFGANRVSGWVKSPMKDDREGVVDAVLAFLENDMRVRVI